MNIGILYDPSHPHVKNWANAIKKTGNNVFIFSLLPHKTEGIETIQIGNYQKISYKHYLQTAPLLKKKLREFNIDILHPIHLTPYGTWGRLANFKPIIPMAIGLDILNYLAGKPNKKTFWEFSKTKPPFTERIKNFLLFYYYKNQIIKNIKQADFVIADGQFLIDKIREQNIIPPEKLKTIHWGVRPELFVPDEKLQETLRNYGIPDKKIILSPRGLAPVYNPALVLKSAEKLLPDLPEDYAVVVLTNGYNIAADMLPIINKLQKNFPEKFVFVRERLTPQLMAQLWLKTEIFVSVPLEDGLPVSLIEAFFTGAIPVLRNIPSYYEALTQKHRKLILREDTPQELSRKILYVINLPAEEKKELIKIGKKWAEEHGNIYKNAEEFVELCRSLL